MALVNTECGLGECIVCGPLDSTYYFFDAMYQHLSDKKHNILELTSLKKLEYRQNEKTKYLSAMNNIPELFSAT